MALNEALEIIYKEKLLDDGIIHPADKAGIARQIAAHLAFDHGPGKASQERNQEEIDKIISDLRAKAIENGGKAPSDSEAVAQFNKQTKVLQEVRAEIKQVKDDAELSKLENVELKDENAELKAKLEELTNNQTKPAGSPEKLAETVEEN